MSTLSTPTVPETLPKVRGVNEITEPQEFLALAQELKHMGMHGVQRREGPLARGHEPRNIGEAKFKEKFGIKDIGSSDVDAFSNFKNLIAQLVVAMRERCVSLLTSEGGLTWVKLNAFETSFLGAVTVFSEFGYENDSAQNQWGIVLKQALMAVSAKKSPANTEPSTVSTEIDGVGAAVNSTFDR